MAGAANYTNRELSWLRFNERVLMEACNPDNPLLERIKFLSIVSSNLDEFFMIRVASLRDLVQAGSKGKDPSGMKPEAQLKELTRCIREQVARQYAILREQILPGLAAHGVRLCDPNSLTREQSAYVSAQFVRDVFPVLTSMAVDSSHNFLLLLRQ